MSLTAAAGGFVVLLLTVPVVQGQDGWGVTYTATEICAPKGSTVEIHCTYRYPYRMNGYVNKLQETFWFIRMTYGWSYENLKTDPEYSGRVQYDCRLSPRSCTLRINNLTESDSAEYKFRFITNQQGGQYTGDPGVTLFVTDRVHLTTEIYQNSTGTHLRCQSNCPRLVSSSYIWYKNGHKLRNGAIYSHQRPFDPTDKYHCGIAGVLSLHSSSVYAPNPPSVTVSPSGEVEEGSSVTLTCSSDANPAARYTWYKINGNSELQPVNEASLSFWRIQSSDSGTYYCTAENDLGWKTSEFSFDVKYAPKLPSVSVSPSGEIVEGSSVTLTCSSDANPAASCTWYKEDQILLQGPEDIYNFSSIRSEDRGFYHCKCENQYGQINSSTLLIDVLYAPKLPSVSVSPSAEIKEGSSVNLTCSSDANPAANYTWYKENQTLLQGRAGIYHFSSISSEDRGFYRCKSKNQYGQTNFSSLLIDVHYAPKLPSVSVSPSAEIKEGSSVNLTCSSDANPAANYTWYKEDDDSAKASGQIFTITNIRAEHSGSYYCEAQNSRGRNNSTLRLTVRAVPSEAWKSAVSGIALLLVLAVIFLSVFLLMRKKRNSKQPPGPEETPDQQCPPNHAVEQDDLYYASIRFLKNQTDAVYSNIRTAGPFRKEEEDEEVEDTEYTVVKFNSSAPRTSGQESGEDPSALYSTVNKTF